MRPSNHNLPHWRSKRWPFLLGVGLYLCLSLLAADAQASLEGRNETVNIAVIAMPSGSMQKAVDCAPCVRCYVAPAPVAQELSGESKEAQAPHWQIHATAQVDAAWNFDTGIWHPRLPVRIEYSRWLN